MVDVTGFVGRADDGPTVDPLVPESLRELLAQAERVVAVEAVGSPGAAQADRLAEGRWRVEVRDAGGARWAEAANTDATFDILRSWAADDGWWEDAFSWTGA